MFIETVIAIWVALGVVSLWLLRRAENAYAGCTTHVVHHGRRFAHAYVCGRLQNLARYGHETQPPRDPRSACDPCLRNMRRGYIAAMWWSGISIPTGFILAFGATHRVVPVETAHPAIAMLAFTVAWVAPTLLAAFATSKASGNALDGGSRN